MLLTSLLCTVLCVNSAVYYDSRQLHTRREAAAVAWLVEARRAGWRGCVCVYMHDRVAVYVCGCLHACCACPLSLQPYMCMAMRNCVCWVGRGRGRAGGRGRGRAHARAMCELYTRGISLTWLIGLLWHGVCGRVVCPCTCVCARSVC